MKTLSIIIPVYNGQGVIGRALDSVYSQELDDNQFEVLCVDDCSPTMDTFDVLNNYTYNGTHPANLKVFRHEVNKRQGGARNTALGYAEGKWVLYLDQDDSFVEDSLYKLSEILGNYDVCDIVMFDYCLLNVACDRSIVHRHIYANQSFDSVMMTGKGFLLKYPIPWTPWCYAYKKNFLKNNKLLFEENVRFEDVDYVIKATLFSENIIFVPLDVYQHVDSGYNTSFVGNNSALIEDLLKISIRIKNVAEEYSSVDEEAAVAAMGHHIYHYHWLLKNIVWRLPYGIIVKMLEEYVPYEKTEDRLIDFTRKHPRVYAALAQVVRPFLLAAIWLRNKLRKR